MERSHRHLRIAPREWDAFMDDVAQTLDKFAVPAAERAEVVAIVETSRKWNIVCLRDSSSDLYSTKLSDHMGLLKSRRRFPPPHRCFLPLPESHTRPDEVEKIGRASCRERV